MANDKPYFDGIKVGDKIYAISGDEHIVTNVYTDMFWCNVYPAIHYDGKLVNWPRLGQVLFWQPPKFEPPPRPKRKVKKEGWVTLGSTTCGIVTSVYVYPTKEVALLNSFKDKPAHIEWEEDE